MPKRFIYLGLFTIGAVVLLAFQSSLSSGYFLDDWRFLRIAGMSVLENLSIYLDPRLQFQWYRPVHGLEYWLSYWLSGANALPVHFARTLMHYASCVLLFALVTEISGKWRIGLVAGLVFAVLHGDSMAVMWVADESLFQVFFFLLALWLWWRFLRNARAPVYWLSFAAFVLALLSKEASISLPVLLVLMEYLLLPRKFEWRMVLRRYTVFGIVWIVYCLIEMYIRLHGTPDWFFEGYRPGTHIFSSLVNYLALVVFPWGLPSPFDYLWLAFVVGVLTYLIIFRKSRVLALLAIGTVLAILPFAPFGGTKARYFYMPALASAVLLAMVADWVGRILVRYRLQWIVAGALTGIVFLAAQQVEDTAIQFAGLARVDRAPLRAITVAYPRLLVDTRVFFIEPKNDPRDLAGMLFVRYGARVTAGSTDRDVRAQLREQPNALVVYRDDAAEYRIVQVENNDSTGAAPVLPLNFEEGIRLDNYELARSTVRRGEPIILFFDWATVQAVSLDYTVFLHLVDQNGNLVGGYDSEPRAGQSHTSRWTTGQVVLDWIILPVPDDVPTGDYHLEIGMYHAPTMRRLAIVDVAGNQLDDKITISPLRLVP